MNLNGVSDSIADVLREPVVCRQCGSVSRIGNGFCVSCLLRGALSPDESEGSENFEAVLDEIEVRDADWGLGNYQILEEIGRGGMGVIYRARQRHSRRIVAVKRVLSYHADSRETLARFRREAEAAASLDHPNILPIYEVSDSEDGLPFFSMKFAPGGSLQEAGPALRNQPRQCVALLAKVARALQYAHGKGILHRDLKPGNILLDGRGEPLVSDFGLAKWLDASSDITRTLTIFGTPGYIAPEQAKGIRAPLTPEADVYSLGAILFDLFTGRPPFIGEHALAVIQQASEKPAPKLRALAPALDRDLETICGKCLEREPQARYRTAGDLAEDLERWLEGRPIVAHPVSPPVRTWRWSKRNPKLAAATLAALASAITAIFLFFSPKTSPPSNKSIAVLPFENLGEKENVYFTQGIQDDIQTNLARIADLNVIGPTSVMQYQPGPSRDVRAIGQALGVAYLLEGGVRGVAGKMQIHAQLIDTRNGARVWTKKYDGNSADVFAIQSEITKTIAAQLHATIAPNEKRMIEQPLTRDLTAFDLYAQAKLLVLKVGFAATTAANLMQAVDLLNQAVERDPEFLLAYCQLASVHDYLYFLGHDRAPARLALADTALKTALRLKPDSGEAHLAQARHLYYGYLKYSEARAEIALAQRTLPNDPLIFQLIAFIDRREDHWEEAERNLKRALELTRGTFFCFNNSRFSMKKNAAIPRSLRF